VIQAKLRIDAAMFEKKMGAVGTRAIPFARESFKKFAVEAYRAVKMYTPPTRSGRTKIKDLWKMQFSRRGTIESYIIKNIYPNQDVILWMEEGTPPHIIRPKKPGGILRWIDEDTGQEMFARLVHHPGTPAYRMVYHAEREMNIRIDYYIAQTFALCDKLTRG